MAKNVRSFACVSDKAIHDAENSLSHSGIGLWGIDASTEQKLNAGVRQLSKSKAKKYKPMVGTKIIKEYKKRFMRLSSRRKIRLRRSCLWLVVGSRSEDNRYKVERATVSRYLWRLFNASWNDKCRKQ